MNKQVAQKKQTWCDELLIDLLTNRPLTLARARRAFTQLFTGAGSFSKAKSTLLLLARRGESANELLGCLQAIRTLEQPIGPRIPSLMDTCGTGGDGRHTINISTLASLVLAGAGVKIAKHGNRAISSKSGSSDLMEAFGIKLDAPAKKMIRAIRELGLGYFHAPDHHPVFAKMQPLRRTLKRRTMLNLLGPLSNPMRLDYQLVGVSEKRLIPLYAKVLSKLGRKTALVCHSTDGMDEISTSVPTTVAWITPNKVRISIIRPSVYGLKAARKSDLLVKSVGESKRRATKILTGKENGAARDTVVLNAAYGFLLCGKVRTVGEGIALAQKTLDSGAAMKVLKQLKVLSN